MNGACKRRPNFYLTLDATTYEVNGVMCSYLSGASCHCPQRREEPTERRGGLTQRTPDSNHAARAEGFRKV